MQTKHLTIMLTDIKGFTSKTASFSRTQVLEMIKKHEELVLPVIQKFEGKLVKTIGDAFLVTFDSPTDAVLCGVEIQNVLKAHNTDRGTDDKIEIRIAINSGEVTLADNDIYGDAVNITARIGGIAEAGQVFFTEAVYLAMNKKEVPSSEIGYRQFKNVPEKIKVYRVLRETPIGRPEQLASAGAAESQATGTVPGPVVAATGVRAGFWRRLGALLVDVTVFLVVLNALGLRACGPDAKIERKDKYGRQEIRAEKVHIGPDGLNIKGDNGETISYNRKDGVKITRPAQPGGKLERTKKLDIGFKTGLGEAKEHGKSLPVTMLLWALYGAVMVWRFGATPGKMILKLKVVDAATGVNTAADKAFLRAFFSLVSLTGLLGYAWALWEKEGRTWHDIIAQTRVIKI
ncbi:MAG: hypothetical protein A2270_09945 [Elusimicrobia bacterium RIFOXYA12_FULL_51_18]|nr:MAG: hypothetical protein A2270_09945 [Elusimicrobia bacterium RIFOXYA12_FULL_51_18]OGS32391.1 MAG: hypothetical protein A2218_02195 [Elusimicrobia bacterium RIFOXYA2_FULL_53_38]